MVTKLHLYGGVTIISPVSLFGRKMPRVTSCNILGFSMVHFGFHSEPTHLYPQSTINSVGERFVVFNIHVLCKTVMYSKYFECAARPNSKALATFSKCILACVNC